MYTVFDPHFLKLSGEAKDYLNYIVEFGIDGIGVDPKLLENEDEAMLIAEQVWNYHLKWGIMHTPVDFYAPNVDDQLFQKGLEQFKRRCSVAEKMKVQYCYNHIWSSNQEREYSENFEWHLKRLLQVQQVCEDHGIFYSLEFLGPRDILHKYKYEFIHSIAGILALSKAAGNKTGFIFDTFHWFCEGAQEDDLYCALTHCEYMGGFHVNDGYPGRKPEFQRDMERAMPMTTGVIDSARIYKLFHKFGYKGPIICEPLYPSIYTYASKSPKECVKAFYEAYQRLKL